VALSKGTDAGGRAVRHRLLRATTRSDPPRPRAPAKISQISSSPQPVAAPEEEKRDPPLGCACPPLPLPDPLAS
jgi:hypothetical protein